VADKYPGEDRLVVANFVFLRTFSAFIISPPPSILPAKVQKMLGDAGQPARSRTRNNLMQVSKLMQMLANSMSGKIPHADTDHSKKLSKFVMHNLASVERYTDIITGVPIEPDITRSSMERTTGGLSGFLGLFRAHKPARGTLFPDHDTHLPGTSPPVTPRAVSVQLPASPEDSERPRSKLGLARSSTNHNVNSAWREARGISEEGAARSHVPSLEWKSHSVDTHPVASNTMSRAMIRNSSVSARDLLPVRAQESPPVTRRTNTMEADRGGRRGSNKISDMDLGMAIHALLAYINAHHEEVIAYLTRQTHIAEADNLAMRGQFKTLIQQAVNALSGPRTLSKPAHRDLAALVRLS